MNDFFDVNIYKDDFDLYHVKYGRGATILAVKKECENSLNIANNINGYNGATLVPITNININIGIVDIEFKFVDIAQYRESFSDNNPEITVVVKRIIPLSQVTFEIIQKA